MTGKAFYHRAFNNAGVMIPGAKMSGNSQVALATPTAFPRPALPRRRRGLATSAHLLPASQHPQHPAHTARPVGPVPTGSGAWTAAETAGRRPGERGDEQSLAALKTNPRRPAEEGKPPPRRARNLPCAPRRTRSHFTHPGHQKGQFQSHQGFGLRNNSWLMAPF